MLLGSEALLSPKSAMENSTTATLTTTYDTAPPVRAAARDANRTSFFRHSLKFHHMAVHACVMNMMPSLLFAEDLDPTSENFKIFP